MEKRSVEKRSNERPTISRPRATSLEAYKAWVGELVRRYIRQPREMDLTEEEWVARWNEYWRERSGG